MADGLSSGRGAPHEERRPAPRTTTPDLTTLLFMLEGQLPSTRARTKRTRQVCVFPAEE